jgi:hypothetical protein
MEQNGRESLRRLQPIVGCNVSKEEEGGEVDGGGEGEKGGRRRSRGRRRRKRKRRNALTTYNVHNSSTEVHLVGLVTENNSIKRHGLSRFKIGICLFVYLFRSYYHGQTQGHILLQYEVWK